MPHSDQNVLYKHIGYVVGQVLNWLVVYLFTIQYSSRRHVNPLLIVFSVVRNSNSIIINRVNHQVNKKNTVVVGIVRLQRFVRLPYYVQEVNDEIGKAEFIISKTCLFTAVHTLCTLSVHNLDKLGGALLYAAQTLRYVPAGAESYKKTLTLTGVTCPERQARYKKLPLFRSIQAQSYTSISTLLQVQIHIRTTYTHTTIHIH